ncbi:lytic transglycosylase domain-containing protein [Sneathiella glossodoripedis]|uniref:lytic transglycosylase domain-containing protein n=1 Tax=Sneathiella glossodoripedis TaxID=418853 RepID=UPI00131F4202|nr:lytic transglycosylase domain-containing protein [Sneathiella glossodoripedis]
MSRNVDAGLRQVPQELMNDPGLIFDRTKWRRRKGRHEEARELLLKMGEDVPHPEIWWPEREIQARKLLRLGHITEAYNLSRYHGLKTGGKFASAEWLAGWIALRFLHEYDEALVHFTRLYENVSYPISRARGAYWIARAYAAMKDEKSAKYWFEEATRYSSTFYGQVAMSELGLESAPELKKKSSFNRETRQRLDKNELVMIVRHLAELDRSRYARPFLLKLTEDATNPQDYVYLGKLASDINRPDFGVAVAKRASQLGTELPDISWPTHTYFPENPPIEKPLILAITRQESAFASDAISPAGARGLMQLMPRTARAVSRKLKVSYGKSKLINDPAYNTLLGSTYLGSLIDRFDGSYILAIASYNAGSSRIRNWIEEWGDPRLNEIDTLDWIELIPFNETRNYVQRVMENLQVYRQLLNEDEIKIVQMGDDLLRGNPTN